MEKLKAQYRSLARDSAQAKRKYQEASKGACQPSPLPPPSPSRCVPSSSLHGSGMAGAPGALWDPQCNLHWVGGPGAAGTGRA